MSLSGLLESIFLRPLESPKRAREMGFWSAGCFFLSTELTLRHLEEKYVMETLNEEYVRFTYTRNFKFRQDRFVCHRMMSTKYLHETGGSKYLVQTVHERVMRKWILGDGRCLCSKLAS